MEATGPCPEGEGPTSEQEVKWFLFCFLKVAPWWLEFLPVTVTVFCSFRFFSPYLQLNPVSISLHVVSK